MNGSGQSASLGLGQSPEDQQPSPLTSPLLTDTGYVRTDDEDEARRKVGVRDGRRAGEKRGDHRGKGRVMEKESKTKRGQDEKSLTGQTC